MGATPDRGCGMTDHCTQILPLRLMGNDRLQSRTVSQRTLPSPNCVCQSIFYHSNRNEAGTTDNRY